MLRQRKVPKRKATPLSASPALRYGATCGARVWRGLAQLAPLRVAQTHASPDPPNPALLGASRGARGTEHPHGPSLRSAPDRGRKRLALRRRGRAQEWPEWLCGCWMFGCPPLLAAPAAGRLRGGTRVGARVLRALTRRGCLNEAATQRSEFHGAPRSRPAAGLPLRNAKGSQTGGRLFFGDFLLAKQKKVTRSPGDSRPPPSSQARGQINAPQRRKTQFKKETSKQHTTKRIAT